MLGWHVLMFDQACHMYPNYHSYMWRKLHEMVRLIIHPSYFVLFGVMMISIRYLNSKPEWIKASCITLKFGSKYVLVIFPLLFMIFVGLTKANYFDIIGFVIDLSGIRVSTFNGHCFYSQYCDAFLSDLILPLKRFLRLLYCSCIRHDSYVSASKLDGSLHFQFTYHQYIILF